jgi:predicted transcriptional regulator
MTDAPATPATANQLELTANIVSAFVTKNHIPAIDLPALIGTIHASLGNLVNGVPAEIVPGALQPAVPVKKSITDKFIICLDDGKKFKSLKRHLRTSYNLSPEEYRAKWGLRPDYPMVAPAYAAERSRLATTMGLGHSRARLAAAAKAAAAPPPPPPAPAASVKKTRGRPRKAA